jgi:Holliday junction resolvase-like predicted endonuclease
LPGATGIYLSEATGCPRKATLRLLKYPAAALSAQSRVNITSGMKGEEKVALVLEAAGWSVHRQAPIQTRFGNGKIDLLAQETPRFTADPVGREVIVEVKTSTLGALNWLPRAEHVDQALLYQGYTALRRLGLADERAPALVGEVVTNTEGVFLPTEVVYLLRADHSDAATGDAVDKEQIVAFPVPWDRARWLHLIGQLELIDAHKRRGVPVPLDLAGERDPGTAPCAYPHTGRCVFWEHCWGQGLVQTAIPGTEPQVEELVEI